MDQSWPVPIIAGVSMATFPYNAELNGKVKYILGCRKRLGLLARAFVRGRARTDIRLLASRSGRGVG